MSQIKVPVEGGLGVGGGGGEERGRGQVGGGREVAVNSIDQVPHKCRPYVCS